MLKTWFTCPCPRGFKGMASGSEFLHFPRNSKNFFMTQRPTPIHRSHFLALVYLFGRFLSSQSQNLPMPIDAVIKKVGKVVDRTMASTWLAGSSGTGISGPSEFAPGTDWGVVVVVVDVVVGTVELPDPSPDMSGQPYIGTPGPYSARSCSQVFGL